MTRVVPYRDRFAPSPSGPLHFGSLLAALASFLEARRAGGEWLVRIEDIDTPRVVRGAADIILRSLENHGLCWDGPVIYQSRRLERYQAALDRLQSAGLAYPCTCSRRELRRFAPLGPGGRIYPGWCRDGPRQAGPRQVGPRQAGSRRNRRQVAIRLRTTTECIAFDDALQGRFEQNLEAEVGDFVIRRTDGLFAYQLAVVVDDADQGVTHVVRGSDLLDSTPRQIRLQRLLGLTTPTYLHIPVAVGSDGDKLSKQTGAPALDDTRPAPSLVAALQFLGQQPPQELAGATPAEVLDWARAHWTAERIPPRKSLGPANANPAVHA